MLLFYDEAENQNEVLHDLDTLVYTGRFFRYFFGRVLLLAIAIGFIALSFFVCMDYMNVNILVRDGFNKRAAAIIMNDDPSVLVKVFTKSFLDKDTLLKSQDYAPYVIRSFNHKLDVGFKIVFPWDRTVQVTITERISYIDGELPKEQAEEAGQADTAPPEWQDGRYVVTLARDEDNWRITDMQLLEKLPKEPAATADSTAPAASTASAPSVSANPSG